MTLHYLTGLYSRFASVIDVIVVYFLIYRVLDWLKRTRAFNVIKGGVLVFLAFLLSYILGFTTLNWIFAKLATVLIILVIIIFHPELRRFLERLGASGYVFSSFSQQSDGGGTSVVPSILTSVDVLSKEKMGALIVIERDADLSKYLTNSVRIQGKLSSDLLSSLFWGGAPTHDGAVILRGNRIEAAGCLLPLTDSPLPDRRLGTRHRAALGLSEVSDALVIVISEETGVISLVEHGAITRFVKKEDLEVRLLSLFQESADSENQKPFSQRIREIF